MPWRGPIAPMHHVPGSIKNWKYLLFNIPPGCSPLAHSRQGRSCRVCKLDIIFCKDKKVSFLELFSIVKSNKVMVKPKFSMFHINWQGCLLMLDVKQSLKFNQHCIGASISLSLASLHINFPFPDVPTLLLLYCLNKPSELCIGFPFSPMLPQ